MSVKTYLGFIFRISVKLLSIFEDVEITGLSHSSGSMFIWYGDQEIFAKAGTDVHTYLNSHTYKSHSNDLLLT